MCVHILLWLTHYSLLTFLSVEFAVLTLDPATKAPRAKIYKPAEIDALLSAEGLTKQDEDTEMAA